MTHQPAPNIPVHRPHSLAGIAKRKNITHPRNCRFTRRISSVTGTKLCRRLIVCRSAARRAFNAFLEGVTFRYRWPRPWRSRSYRNVYPRKSRLLPAVRRSTTFVLSRFSSRPSQDSIFVSIKPLIRLPW
jgi:hypothetical protein